MTIPLKFGPRTGARILSVREITKSEDVTVGRRRTVRSGLSDLLAAPRAQDREVCRMADTTYNNEWTRADSNTTWMETDPTVVHHLPSLVVERPHLQRHGAICFEYCGIVFHNSFGTEELEWQMTVDGVPLAETLLSWSNSTVHGTGILLFLATLRVVGTEPGNGNILYDCDTRLVIRDDVGGTVIDQSKGCQPVLSPESTQSIGWNVRKALGISGHGLILRSCIGGPIFTRSGF